jgi:hypothetical protein
LASIRHEASIFYQKGKLSTNSLPGSKLSSRKGGARAALDRSLHHNPIAVRGGSDPAFLDQMFMRRAG